MSNSLEAYERWKQNQLPASPQLREWLKNDRPPETTFWDQIVPIVTWSLIAILLFFIYRFRIRILTAVEEFIVVAGSWMVLTARNTRLAFARVAGRIRQRADQSGSTD